jgi:hypothetical protein
MLRPTIISSSNVILSRAKSYKQKHSASLGKWRAILTQTICRCSDNAKLPVFSSHPLGDLEEEPG